MSNADIRDRIRAFLSEEYASHTAIDTLSDGESLQEAGVIDSFGILSLITFLESAFEIHIPDSDVLPENLDSVAQLSGYIARRTSGKL